LVGKNYSALINDENLTKELIDNGANIGKKEIQLAAEYGRASILKTLLKDHPDFDKNNIKIPSLYSPTRFFWAPTQNYLGYEADYVKTEQLLECEAVQPRV
jgi:hypothetical protein